MEPYFPASMAARYTVVNSSVIFLNGGIIVLQCVLVSALQYCVSFCCFNKVNKLYKYTHGPSFLSLPLTFQATCLDHHRAPSELPALHSSSLPATYFKQGSVCASVLLSQFIPPSSSPTVSTHPSSMSAVELGSSAAFF